MIKATNDPNGSAPRAAGDGTYDVVVVGAGAAGLNAALLLGRARRTVAVIDAGEPRNAPAAHVHGFLSRDGLSPATLLELGRAEIARYGVRLIQGRVEQIDHGYDVRLVGGPVLKARRVLVATGLRDELPDIPGVRERWGKDLLHCPYCHAHEVRDRPLAVLGTHPGAVHQALLLRDWSDDVIFFAHTLELTAQDRERLEARGLRIVEGEIEHLAIVGGRLRGVELTDGRAIPRAAAFLFPRMVPRDELLTHLGCAKDDNGWVTTDRTGRTSVASVWAAGNVIDPRAQVITAAGMGSTAAFAINTDLLEEDVDHAVERRRAAARGRDR
ncbi:NAD(P)/FAD-dependent oxidoreductase [Actinoallomurus rhizosphaericola]|uniref:NAD(P)/FAD-dependent oxidoreductase n=1 Tax=Actinoallomurus rhizosphaericola TaxID=2952536 RepID=UPI002092ECDB|nr:NAD(P)/FAD-dependent oxidoreductase [Actinoallomurus rhizosphaericola]MCO5996688.1 NAD(P)/FAD-dependent oxidoreductase [Actinoallomurus rhizosphaericola]